MWGGHSCPPHLPLLFSFFANVKVGAVGWALRVVGERVGFHGRVPLGIFGLMKFLRTRAGGADYHTRLYFGGVLRSSPCPDSSQTQCDGHYCAAPGICAKVQWGKR